MRLIIRMLATTVERGVGGCVNVGMRIQLKYSQRTGGQVIWVAVTFSPY